MDPEFKKKIWGKWFGREQEFYKECARLISPFSWEDVRKTCGPDVEALSHMAAHAYREVTTEKLPANLKVGTFNVTYVGSEFSAVVTYSPMDPISLPKPLVDVLYYFDGRPTQKAIDDISEKEDIELEIGLVQKLVDYGVLVPFDPEASPKAAS